MRKRGITWIMKRELPDDGQISASGSSDFAAYDLARTASRRRHQRVGRDRAYASRGFAEEVGHAIAAWGTRSARPLRMLSARAGPRSLSTVRATPANDGTRSAPPETPRKSRRPQRTCERAACSRRRQWRSG